MHYEIDYVFQLTYHKPNSMCCHTEFRHFKTELERNRFALEWFSKAKQGEVVLKFAQKQDLRTWRK